MSFPEFYFSFESSNSLIGNKNISCFRWSERLSLFISKKSFGKYPNLNNHSLSVNHCGRQEKMPSLHQRSVHSPVPATCECYLRSLRRGGWMLDYPVTSPYKRVDTETRRREGNTKTRHRLVWCCQSDECHHHQKLKETKSRFSTRASRKSIDLPSPCFQPPEWWENKDLLL